MNQPEPTLGQVRDELKSEMGVERRVRATEIQQAITSTALDGLTRQVVGMEGRLIEAIEANKPKPIWPAVSAMVAALAVILVVAERLYGA